MNDLGKAFGYMFKDTNWLAKFLVGSIVLLLCLVLIGIPIIAGYLVQTTQRVMRRDPSPLPEWDDIGGKFVLGFKMCLVFFVYALPLMLLYIPLLLLLVMGEVMDHGDLTGAFAGLYSVGMFVLILPYTLCLMLFAPIITYRFAMRERIGDAFDIASIWRDFRRNWQDTVIVALIGAGLQSFAGIGIIFFFVGILFTVLYSYLVTAYMFGTLYRELYPQENAA